MASIDKIYGTKEQRDELMLWCADNLPSALVYFYPEPEWAEWDSNRDFALTNFPEHIDYTLWDECPIEFVKERLRQQYGHSGPKDK